MNQGGTLAAGGTSLTVTDAGTLGVGTNDYIKIADEILRVSNVVGNVLTVSTRRTRAQLVLHKLTDRQLLN